MRWFYLILLAANFIGSRSRMTSEPYLVQSLLPSRRDTSGSQGCALAVTCLCFAIPETVRSPQELRKLEAANNGSTAAYQHVLFLAYGRKGKLRRELMEVSPHISFVLRPTNLLQPLLGDPSAPLPPPIISPVESSRPPVYSPEMTALLGSDLSHRGSSPRKPKQLQHPPTLPPRADPESSDAKILGPLSKRREVNLRWRFFEEETAKVLPPIEVSRVHTVEPPTSLDEPVETGTIKGAKTGGVSQSTSPPVGFQGTSVLSDLESIASPNPNVPKHATSPPLPNPTNNTPPTSKINRFIRRQHRKLLGKIPILTYFKHPTNPVGKYEVSLSPLVGLTSAIPMADEADLAWLRLPPPPRESRVELESPLSQEPKADQNPRVYGKLRCTTQPWPQKLNWADAGDPPDEHRLKEGVPGLKVDPISEVEELPKVETKSEVGRNPQAPVEPMRTVRPHPMRSDWTDEPPNQLKRRPRDRPPRNSADSEDSKRSRPFGGTTDERLHELPSRSIPPALNSVRLFKGSLVRGGFGVPRPKP